VIGSTNDLPTASAVSRNVKTVETVLTHAVSNSGLKPGANEREAVADYRELFIAAFGSPEITPEKIGLAIESFVLTLTSFDSKFDRALKGETQLNEDEKRGFELFMTEYDPRREQFGADCFHCHGGPLFQSQTFANNGLDSNFTDLGRAKITGKDSDHGKFSTPSLRNVALTAPYMHDGRFKTLEEVVEHYATGLKRSATLDPNLAKHPDGGVPLSAPDKRALVAFLQTLTDKRFAQANSAAAK
jgi:cytochrome c peroxidase